MVVRRPKKAAEVEAVEVVEEVVVEEKTVVEKPAKKKVAKKTTEKPAKKKVAKKEETSVEKVKKELPTVDEVVSTTLGSESDFVLTDTFVDFTLSKLNELGIKTTRKNANELLSSLTKFQKELLDNGKVFSLGLQRFTKRTQKPTIYKTRGEAYGTLDTFVNAHEVSSIKFKVGREAVKGTYDAQAGTFTTEDGKVIEVSSDVAIR